MNVYYSPQVNTNTQLEYQFEGEIVTVTLTRYDEAQNKIIESDIFDFSTLPDNSSIIIEEVVTTLYVNPLLEVYKENGELFLKLLNFIDDNATETEKFPEWVVI